MNVLSTTGDAEPLLRLNVEGLQPLNAENREQFESLRRQWGEKFRQERTHITTRVTAWDIKSVDHQEARIDVTKEIEGVERGQPIQKSWTDEVKLLKVDGEWLEAPLGK